MTEHLDNLRIGDTVTVLTCNPFGAVMVMKTVSELTDTEIKCGNEHFTRNGSNPGASTYWGNRLRIIPPIEVERRMKVNETTARYKAVYSRLEEACAILKEDVTLNNLAEMRAALDQAEIILRECEP